MKATQINVEDFIRHTKRMAEMSRDKGDSGSEVFFNSVIVYVDEYLKVFGEDK